MDMEPIMGTVIDQKKKPGTDEAKYKNMGRTHKELHFPDRFGNLGIRKTPKTISTNYVMYRVLCLEC